MKSLRKWVEGGFSGAVGYGIGIVAGRRRGERDVEVREPFGRTVVAGEIGGRCYGY